MNAFDLVIDTQSQICLETPSVRGAAFSVSNAKRDCGRFLTAYEKEKLSRSIYVTDNAGNRESINN